MTNANKLNKDIVDSYWQVLTEEVERINASVAKSLNGNKLVDCPNHGGAYDCTPFCNLCEGNQEYEVTQ